MFRLWYDRLGRTYPSPLSSRGWSACGTRIRKSDRDLAGILWRPVKGEGFNDLLGGPLRRRMNRHIEMKDASAVVSEYDKDKQSLETDAVHGEDVDRN